MKAWGTKGQPKGVETRAEDAVRGWLGTKKGLEEVVDKGQKALDSLKGQPGGVKACTDSIGKVVDKAKEDLKDME